MPYCSFVDLTTQSAVEAALNDENGAADHNLVLTSRLHSFLRIESRRHVQERSHHVPELPAIGS